MALQLHFRMDWLVPRGSDLVSACLAMHRTLRPEFPIESPLWRIDPRFPTAVSR